jgi:hypothetical protein
MSEADIRAAIEGSIELTAPTKVAGNGKIETPEARHEGRVSLSGPIANARSHHRLRGCLQLR